MTNTQPITADACAQYLRRTRRLREVAIGVATDAVLTDTARAWGVTVTDAQLQQAANRFRAANGLADAAATKAWLAAADWTRADFEDFLEREVLAEVLPAKLFADQGAAYFADRGADFARVTFVVASLPTDAAAQEVTSQVTNDGADMATVAPGARTVTMWRGGLPAAEATALFAATPGELVGPFPSAGGFRLYQLVKTEAADLTDPATAVEVRRQLFEAWINRRLADTPIDLSPLRPSLTAPVSVG